MWFWFVIGLILAIAGVIVMSSDADIEIGNVSFDACELGMGFAIIGGALAFFMLLGLGISGLASLPSA